MSELHGLQKLCKSFGCLKINGQIMMWDYVADVAVPDSEMKMGSARWAESEKVRWKNLKSKK